MSGRVSLRPMRDHDDDYERLARWLCHPDVLSWVVGRDQPHSIERVRDDYGVASLAREHTWPSFIEVDGRAVGYLQVVWVLPYASDYSLDGDARHAWAFDLWIGDPAWWGRGVGTMACQLAVDQLLARGARRIVIDPRVVNERAVHVYEKVGFRKVKMLPAYELHEGERWDNWLMEYVPPA